MTLGGASALRGHLALAVSSGHAVQWLDHLVD